MKLDFDKIGNLATLIKAGMSINDIKAYAEVIETSPNIDENAALEDIKAEAEIKSVDELPVSTDTEQKDTIQTLKDLIKED